MLVPVAGLVRRRRLLRVPPRAWVALLLALAAGLCVVAALNGHPRTTAHPALDVASVAVHLFAVAVWVGGLGALVVLAFPVWRHLADGERTASPAPRRGVTDGGCRQLSPALRERLEALGTVGLQG